MTSGLPQRDPDGKLPAYAWPGGYPIVYFDRENNEFCADCATIADDPDEVPQFRPNGFGILLEGAPSHCCGCNKEIESAYGDPEEQI